MIAAASWVPGPLVWNGIKYGKASMMAIALHKVDPLSVWSEMERLPSFLPSFFRLLQEQDPNGTYCIAGTATAEVNQSRFATYYIATGDAKEFWNLSRRILAVDACHLTEDFGWRSLDWRGDQGCQQPSAASSSEPLCLRDEGILARLPKTIQSLDFKDAVVFLSDKDKGGQAAMEELGIPSSICAWHLNENLRKGKLLYGNELGSPTSRFFLLPRRL